MNKKGPIIIIEDDMDDQDILVEIFHRLGYENKIIYFTDGNEALRYLDQTDIQPFLILSDINMPRINGFELRNKVFTNEQLQTKCIPTCSLRPRHEENGTRRLCPLRSGFFR